MKTTTAAWIGVLAAAIGAGCGDDESVTPAAATGATGGTGGTGGAGGAGGAGGMPAAFCSGPTALIYDPVTSKAADAWPDDYWSVDDTAAVTGLRVKIVDGDNFVLPEASQRFRRVFEDLSTLDGFGTTAALYVTFTGPVDAASLPTSGDGSGTPEASVVLITLDDAAPELVDVELTVVPEAEGNPRTTMVITPMVPLKPQTRYGLGVTTRVKDAEGSCIAPSAPMQELLSGEPSSPELARLAGRYGDLVAALRTAGVVEAPQELTAGVVFTTQHTVEDSVTIATDIRSKTFDYAAAGPCTDAGAYLVCEGSFEAFDYRKDHHAIDDADLTAHDPVTIPVTTYLPKVGTKPHRTLVYGHGLNGDRHQAEQLAMLAAPAGYATIAIDAVEHGDHPNKTNGPVPVADFFAISIGGPVAIDARKLRDNFRQSTYDKLQLVEMLRPGVDIDGDASVDVGLDQLSYLGVSLGGIMAAELLALSPDFKVAVPIVPGARVSQIIPDSVTFAPVIPLLLGSATDGDIARFFPVLQTAIDRGDAGAYTPHIVKSRLPGVGGVGPQVLMQMVIDDETVPNAENRYYARGLGVPHVGDELQKIGAVPHEQALPVTGNVDATHTGGVFQYDLVCADMCPAPTEAATHGNVAGNPVAIAQTLHFMETFFSGGTAEILDPYKTLGVKP